MHRIKQLGTIATVLLALGALVAISGCGGDDEPQSNATDKAFVEAMIPHHAMAVQSAQYQYVNGDDNKTRSFARDIVNFQMAEITELDRIGKELGAQVDPAWTAPLNRKNEHMSEHGVDENTAAALEVLGLTAQQAGMTGDMNELTDTEFVEMMIPHHQGAIRMARVQVEKGGNPELTKLARNIIALQSREIEELQQIKP